MSIAVTGNQSRKDVITSIAELFDNVSKGSTIIFSQQSQLPTLLVDFMFTDLKPKYRRVVEPTSIAAPAQQQQQATNILDEFGLSNNEIAVEQVASAAPRKVSNVGASSKEMMNGGKFLVQKAVQEASNTQQQPLPRKIITFDRASGNVNVTPVVTLQEQQPSVETGGVRDIESRLKKRSAALAGRDLDSLIKEQREEDKYQRGALVQRMKRHENSGTAAGGFQKRQAAPEVTKP